MATTSVDERPRTNGEAGSTLQPNIQHVVFGKLQIKPWYPSFYPKELVGNTVERLHVCHWCFKYSKEVLPYVAHLKACPLKHEPSPGSLLYSKDNVTIHEVDGEAHKLYAQNLSLFAKLFLDTKSVFYDVSTFDYYTMSLSDASTRERQVVGFFSKEKMSWDNNNVACILVFPPWQRQGLGQVLIGVSYELSRLEDRRGGPEKPLSALGRKGYGLYWCAAVCRGVLKNNARRISIQDVMEETFMLAEDVIAALQMMGALQEGRKPNGDLLIDGSKIQEWAHLHDRLIGEVVSRDSFVKARVKSRPAA